MLQAHRDSVRLVFNKYKPTLSNTVFHLLSGGDDPYFIDSPDTNLWALAQTDTSSLVVTEFNTELNPQDDNDPINTLSEIAVVMMKQFTSMNTKLTNISNNLALLNTLYADISGQELRMRDINREYKL
jgi:hypothetical protein